MKNFHAGLDTVSLAWRGQAGSRVLSAIGAAPTFKQARGVVVAEPAPSGMRVLAWPEHGLVAAEGRLAAVLAGRRDCWDLAGISDLQRADEAMREQMRVLLDVEPEDVDAEVRRYDLTTERSFEHPEQGLAFLRALGHMCPPRLKLKKVETADGRTETVWSITPRRGRVLARAYDKGVESGSHPPGHRVRLEAQNRPPRAARFRPVILAERDLRPDFARTLAPFLEGGEAVVTSPAGVVHHLAGKVARDELSMARAERMAGSVEFLRAYGRAFYASDADSARRLRDLRRAGVVVDDALPDRAQLPVSDLLREAVEGFAP